MPSVFVVGKNPQGFGIGTTQLVSDAVAAAMLASRTAVDADTVQGSMLTPLERSKSPSDATSVTGLLPGSSALVRQLNAVTLAAQLAVAGSYLLPQGAFEHDAFTMTAPVRLFGQGRNNAYGPINTGEAQVSSLVGKAANTTLRCASSTADFITVAAPGCEFSGIHFENTSSTAPTAGSALKMGGGAGVPADGFSVHDCSFNRWWIAVDVNNAVGYGVHDNLFYAPVKYGVRVQNVDNGDEGDPCIYANWFGSVTNADAAIYFKSGGGLKIWGNKIWRAPPSLATAASEWFKKGIWIDNPPVATSVLIVYGNSFETINEHAVFVDCSTSGDYSNITIQGNQVFSQGGIGGNNSIEIQGRAGQLLHCVNIAGNVFHQAVGIKLSYVESGAIGQNTWHQPRSALVTLGSGTAGVDVLPQAVSQPGGVATPNASLIYFQDLDANNSWKALSTRGQRIHRYAREIGDNGNSQAAVTGSYVTMYQIRVPEYASCEFIASFFASSSSNGQASLRIHRFVGNEFQAPTLGIVGTDFAIARVGGTTGVQTVPVSTTNPVIGDIDVQLVTGNGGTGGDIFVNVNVKLKAGATGTALQGTLELEVKGAVTRIQRGP